MTLDSGKVLVTGGAGFIGSHLVDALVARGCDVRIIDALVEQVHGGRVPEHLNPRAEFIHGDVGNHNILEAALEGVSTVFHLAAEVGVGQSMYEMRRYVDANSSATATLLECAVARREKIRKIVVASSMSIYGEGAYSCSRCGARDATPRADEQLARREWELVCSACGGVMQPLPTSESKPLAPASIYAISKQDQEQMALVVGHAYQIAVAALRFFNVYGPRQSLSNPYTGICAIFSSRLMNDEPPIIFEDGAQTRDFVHVSDIAQALMLAAESDDANGHAINVGTGRASTVRDIAQLLARYMGKTIEPHFPHKYRAGDIRHCVADITRARQLLGFEPRVVLEDGLRELVDWLRSQRAEDHVGEATRELERFQLVR